MKIWLVIAGLVGASGVMIAAFGEHALAGRLEPRLFAAFATAGRYQMIHALAIGLAAMAAQGAARPWARAAAALLLAGTLLFCGSLYLLALTGIRALGIVTPLGGLALIAGWLLLAMAGWRWPNPAP